MAKDKILIETMGYIKKEAHLSTVESNIVSNTFVLESLHPFPGYHGKNLPEKTTPRSLFLILSSEYSFEEIARITKKIQSKLHYDFNASIGNIYFRNSSYSCIRIKYLKSFTFLPDIQNCYQDEGIKFAKTKSINKPGLIIIKKHFYVEELNDGIYRDIEEDSKFYIELPKDLPWNKFKDYTTHIKNNMDNSNFDAAQGVFYRKTGIVELVRIYICEGEFEKISYIQKMYIDKINKEE